jgi:hypothetical protein
MLGILGVRGLIATLQYHRGQGGLDILQNIKAVFKQGSKSRVHFTFFKINLEHVIKKARN